MQMELLWFLLIGLIAGWIAGMLVGGGGSGLIGNMIVGVIGAFVGGFLFRSLDISVGGQFGPLITAVAGAVVLLYGIRLMRGII